jgi:hypothetical protein
VLKETIFGFRVAGAVGRDIGDAGPEAGATEALTCCYNARRYDGLAYVALGVVGHVHQQSA